MNPLKAIKLIAAIIMIGAHMPAQAYSPSYYSTNSRLNSGHWIKIATRTEGIHQFTYDELRQMGFDNPESVQVYGYGALKFSDHIFASSAPDDLKPVATMHTSDGRILFFGQADYSISSASTTGYDIGSFNISRNFYDTASYYFLSDTGGSTSVPFKTAIQPSSSEPSHTHIHLEAFEEDLQNPIQGGVNFHGLPLEAGASLPFEYHMRHYDGADAYDMASFVYFLAYSSSVNEAADVTYSDNVIKQSAYNMPSWSLEDGSYTAYNEARGYVSFIGEGEAPFQDENVTFTLTIPSSNEMRYAALERTIFRYPRLNKLDDTDPSLMLNFGERCNSSGQKIVFPDVTDPSDIVIWSVDNPADIRRYPTSYDPETGELSFVISENKTRRAIAFRPSAQYPGAEVVGVVAPQNLHGSATPDMLIITTKEYKPIADELAEAHKRYQGLEVAVVDQEEIFNEFSSGARDAMAYRRYAKMYYDRSPEKFKYLLLLGPCNYDNRAITVGSRNNLLTYQNTNTTQTRNIITNYTCDAIFGMLANDYNHDNLHLSRIQVAVGRIPALNTAQASAYVKKAISRLQGNYNPEAFNRVLLLSGEGDRNTHLNHSLEVRDSMEHIHPDFTFFNIGWQVYVNPSNAASSKLPTELITQTLKRGAGYMTFSGHGQTNFIGSAMWTKSNASETEYDNYPFIMFSSCDQFAFDRQQSGLVETMLFSENGGILGGVGASRSVYITHNQLECVPVAQAYAMSKNGDTYGDILIRSRDIICNRYYSAPGSVSTNAMINCMAYNLGGDPALPIGVPGCGVQITEIDGHEPGTDLLEVKPLKPFRIKGAITGSEGSIDNTFNGTAHITVLAPVLTTSTYNVLNENNYNSINVDHQFTNIAEVEVPVTNGSFDAEMIMPVPSILGTNRLVVTAMEDGGDRVAHGTASAFEVSDYNPAEYENETYDAPEILEFYAEAPTFVSGSEVSSSSIEVTAVIEPSSTRLLMSNSGVGSRTTLTIDNVSNITNLEQYIHPNQDGTVTLSTRLDDLEQGIHSLTLTCVNNAGLATRSTIDFVVNSHLERPILNTSSDVARTEAILELEGNTAATSDNRLVITDIHGHTVFSESNVSFPYHWNLKGNNGAIVPDGHYRASLTLRADRDYTHAIETQIVVIR